MDDKDLIKYILAFLTAYIVVVLIENGLKIYRWLRPGKEPVDTFSDGVIPRDYSERLKRAQQAAHNRTLANPLAEELELDVAHSLDDLRRMRELVARVRHQGFIAGSDDLHNDVLPPKGILSNKYLQGSGAAQQWARGYCQGAGVCGDDVKKYMDSA